MSSPPRPSRTRAQVLQTQCNQNTGFLTEKQRLGHP